MAALPRAGGLVAALPFIDRGEDRRKLNQLVLGSAANIRAVAAAQLADDEGALAVRAVGLQRQVVHRVQDPAVDGLEAVADVGQRSADDHASQRRQGGCRKCLEVVQGADAAELQVRIEPRADVAQSRNETRGGGPAHVHGKRAFAERHDRPIGTVKSRISRARDLLRRQLAPWWKGGHNHERHTAQHFDAQPAARDGVARIHF